MSLSIYVRRLEVLHWAWYFLKMRLWHACLHFAMCLPTRLWKWSDYWLKQRQTVLQAWRRTGNPIQCSSEWVTRRKSQARAVVSWQVQHTSSCGRQSHYQTVSHGKCRHCLDSWECFTGNMIFLSFFVIYLSCLIGSVVKIRNLLARKGAIAARSLCLYVLLKLV